MSLRLFSFSKEIITNWESKVTFFPYFDLIRHVFVFVLTVLSSTRDDCHDDILLGESGRVLDEL
jgi:hypothetical protein